MRCPHCGRGDGAHGEQEQHNVAWLIEIGQTVFQTPMWWDGEDWTPDPKKAVHYCRKKDAERVIFGQQWEEAKAIHFSFIPPMPEDK